MSKLYLFLLFAVFVRFGEALKCYTCIGENICKQGVLIEEECGFNLFQTYNMLSSHYNVKYTESANHSEYECFSIDSELTGENSNANRELIFRGCIEKGFDVCNLKYDPNMFNNEVKKECYSCQKDLCNGGGFVAGSLWTVIGLTIVSIVKCFKF